MQSLQDASDVVEPPTSSKVSTNSSVGNENSSSIPTSMYVCSSCKLLYIIANLRDETI